MKIRFIALLLLLVIGITTFGFAQSGNSSGTNAQDVRVMTIPISISSKSEASGDQSSELLDVGALQIKEDSELQEILSVRSISNTPLSIEILIQDDLTRDFNLNLGDITNFILDLPEGTRVMIGYIRGGSLDIRQKFTTNLQKAASAVRIATGSSSSAPASPYYGVKDGLDQFDSQPKGRRAMLLFSDGLDATNGLQYSTPNDSLALSKAISDAQRKAVAIYSIYSSATYTETGNTYLISNGQNSLKKLSDETGGKAYFQGSYTPVSFKPFLEDFDHTLTRQFALSYLSTHMNSGFHRVLVTSTNPDVTIEAPSGYYYKKNK